jgi:ATP/ADP translocase
MITFLKKLKPKDKKKAKIIVDEIADIAKNIGNITVGSIIIPYIFDKQEAPMSIVGIVIALFFWIFSVTLTYKYNE